MRALAVLGFLAGAILPIGAADFPRPANLTGLRAAYPVNDQAMARLTQQGFVVLADRSVRGLHEAYPSQPRDPYVYVTTDAMLQLWHDLYIEVLKEAERTGMTRSLKQAIGSLARSAADQYRRATEPSARQALRESTVLLCVADRLLGGSSEAPAALRGEVDALVAKVMAHRDAGRYPGDDYTQYTVRGHYAQSADLGRYFRASMWLSRRFMAVRDDAPLRRAVALASVLRSQASARRTLAALNNARASLAGKPNAISVEQVLQALDRLLGPKWELTDALRASNLRALRRALSGPSYPPARVHTASALPGQFPSRVVALVPDYAVPDSVLFQQTVYDAVPGRSLPSGRDVAAALGFQVAADDLRRTEPQARAVLAAVERNRSRFADQGGSVYRGWLHALATLARTDARAPDFMKSAAWAYEKMNTCLTGWAQLRHANILYAAHPYASYGLSLTAGGLVEANPPFFRAMAAVADRTARAIGAIGGLTALHRDLLGKFAAKCREFAACADAELNGKLTQAQSESIHGFGAWLGWFPFQSKPVIADVATGTHMEVLHAGSGDLNPIIVLPDRTSRIAYVGWVGSYYEIVMPDARRLTDEAWQSMLEHSGAAPERPAWTGEFACMDRGERWTSRAPLREAERLLAVGKPADALAVLQRTIEHDPASEVATECRLRMARHYRKVGRHELAADALALCLQMHGGDAWDRARDDLREMIWRREANAMPEVLQARKEAAEVARYIARLRRMAPGRARTLLEDEAAIAAIGGHRRDDARTSKLDELLKACREPAAREALEYVRLITMSESSRRRTAGRGPDTLVTDCLRLARKARSPLIRAEMEIVAFMHGHMRDRPLDVARRLADYTALINGKGDSSPSVLLLSRARTGRDEPVLRGLYSLIAGAGRGLIRESWQAGRIEEALQIGRMLPESMVQPTRAECEALAAEFGDYGWAPLGMYARAEARRGIEAATDFLAVYRRFPASKIAPLALRNAEQALRSAARDADQADQLRSIAVERWPEHPVGLLYRAEDALAKDRLDEAEALARKVERLASEPKLDAVRLLAQRADFVLTTCRGIRDTRQILGPVLEPAGRTDLLRAEVLREAGYLPDRIVERAPELATDIRLAYLRARRDWGAAFDFLRYHHDHPAAGEAWAAMRKETSSWSGPLYPFPESVAWLPDIVNRGASYSYAADAAGLLDRCFPWDQLDYVRSRAIALREICPGTRAAAVVAMAEARSLLIAYRPEEACDVLRKAAGWLPVGDPLLERLARLQACAVETIAAKRRPPWQPLRSYRLPRESWPRDDERPAWEQEVYTDDLSILLSRETLNASAWAIHDGVLYLSTSFYDLIALDTATGARLAYAVTPLSPATVLRIGPDGLIVIRDEGEAAVYPLVKPP